RRRAMWNNVRRLMNIGMGCRVYRNELVPPFPLADDFVMYNLRHTYCTDLEKAGVPINIACRLMGHSDISMTSRIYTHASVESLEIARNLIDERSKNSAPGTQAGTKFANR
ncbi:MAG: tyrosine-type recombinase/integrase, partial [Clostridiales bacterium]|nr:tyrosine-type recombinase/integrase [Clostridiales bacterium]